MWSAGSQSRASAGPRSGLELLVFLSSAAARASVLGCAAARHIDCNRVESIIVCLLTRFQFDRVVPVRHVALRLGVARHHTTTLLVLTDCPLLDSAAADIPLTPTQTHYILQQ